MRLTSAGNVGIGTISPGYLIELSSATSSVLAFRNTTTNSWRGITFLNGATDPTEYAYIKYNATSGELRYYANPAAFGGYATFYSNNTEAMRITSGGNLLIGTTDSAARLVVRGSSTSGSDFAMWVTDSIGGLVFSCRNDKLICSPGTYSYAYASTANVFVQSDGYLGRNTSSLKYKHSIEDYQRGLSDILKLRPVLYESNNPSEAGKKFTGFIAEEIDALGLIEFVQYAEDGSPDALQYPHFVSLLTKALQELKAERDMDKQEIEQLKFLLNNKNN